MAWLDIAEFKARFVTESATETLDDQIDPCLRTGVRKVTQLVGETLADEVDAAAAPYSTEVEDIRDAQGLLSYRALLLNQSSRTRDGGIIESERDANGDTVNKYVPYAEVQQRRKDLYDEAMETLAPFLDAAEAAAETGVTSISSLHWF